MTVDMSVSVFFFLPGVLEACFSELSVTMPREIRALSGSCLLIPCNFTNSSRQVFDGRRDTFGIWRRNKRSVFNSNGEVKTYPMNITGNLREKNCTTLFSDLIPDYSGKYTFRIINLPYKATDVCNPLQIIVTDSPWSPTLEVSGDTPTDLKETQSVTITCSAPTPCPHSPPGLTWSPQRPAHSQVEEDRRGTFITKIQQNVTLSERHDGRTISCSAVYPVDGGEAVRTSEANFTLSVSYAPKETSASISPAGVVSVGSWVNLTCSCRARPAAIYTWFKTSDCGAVRVSGGNFHSFNVTNVTDGGVYYCVTHNALGNQTSESLRLNVEGGSEGSLDYKTLLGLTIALIVLICLITVGILLHWRRTKTTDSRMLKDEKTSSSLPDAESEGKETAGRREDEGDDIHYGEISFSQHKPESASRSEVSRMQEVTVYAEVKASRPTADAPEDLDCLYAEVKKK